MKSWYIRELWNKKSEEWLSKAYDSFGTLRGFRVKDINDEIETFFKPFLCKDTLENSWYNEYIAGNDDLVQKFESISKTKISVEKVRFYPKILKYIVCILVGGFVCFLAVVFHASVLCLLLTTIGLGGFAYMFTSFCVSESNEPKASDLGSSIRNRLYEIRETMSNTFHSETLTTPEIIAKMPGEGSYAEKLYTLLTTDIQYRTGDFTQNDLKEGMAVAEEYMYGWSKPRFIINHNTKCAYEFMDSDQTLLTVTQDDIDWDSIKKLPDYALNVAKNLSGHFPTIIHDFNNGVAGVRWELHPSGYYYMDEDGFGMTGDVEMEVWGAIDTQGKVVEKFSAPPSYIEDVLKHLRFNGEEV